MSFFGQPGFTISSSNGVLSLLSSDSVTVESSIPLTSLIPSAITLQSVTVQKSNGTHPATFAIDASDNVLWLDASGNTNELKTASLVVYDELLLRNTKEISGTHQWNFVVDDPSQNLTIYPSDPSGGMVIFENCDVSGVRLGANTVVDGSGGLTFSPDVNASFGFGFDSGGALIGGIAGLAGGFLGGALMSSGNNVKPWLTNLSTNISSCIYSHCEAVPMPPTYAPSTLTGQLTDIRQCSLQTMDLSGSNLRLFWPYSTATASTVDLSGFTANWATKVASQDVNINYHDILFANSIETVNNAGAVATVQWTDNGGIANYNSTSNTFKFLNGAISANSMSVGTLNCSILNATSVNVLSANTVSCNYLLGASISSTTISTNLLAAPAISSTRVSSNLLATNSISSVWISASVLSADSFSCIGNISSNTISTYYNVATVGTAGIMNVTNTLNVPEVDATIVYTVSIAATTASITALSASTVSANLLKVLTLSSTTTSTSLLAASSISVTTISSSLDTASSISATTVSASLLKVLNLSNTTLSSSLLQSNIVIAGAGAGGGGYLLGAIPNASVAGTSTTLDSRIGFVTFTGLTLAAGATSGLVINNIWTSTWMMATLQVSGVAAGACPILSRLGLASGSAITAYVTNGGSASTGSVDFTITFWGWN